MIEFKYLLSFLIIASVSGVYGQQANYYFGSLDSTIWDLEEVIVTATRTQRQLSALPLPAILINKEELMKSNVRRVSDILEEQTGLVLVPDFNGGLGVQMQGLDPDYTLILIDGMPLIGRSAGSLDLSRISVGNIKKIELVKGASSSLYGSEALSGVINIITESGDQSTSGKLGYQIGSFISHDLTGSYQLGSFQIFGNFYSSGGYDLNPTDDWITVEPFQHATLQAKYHTQWGEKWNIKFSGRGYQQNQDYTAPGELKGATAIKEFNVHFKADYAVDAPTNHALEAYVTQYRADEFLNDANGNLFDQQAFTQTLIRPEWRANKVIGQEGTITMGIGATLEKVNRTDFTAVTDFQSPYGFAQWQGNIWDKINIIGGLRLDAHNVYANQLSPKIAIYYPFNEKWSIKGSVGRGFKAPDFRQLYFNFSNSSAGYGVLGTEALAEILPIMNQRGEIANIFTPEQDWNQSLNPERSINLNLSLTFEKNQNLSLSVNGFFNQMKDLIDTRLVARKTNGQQIFSYYNIASVQTLGTEWNVSWRISENVNFSGGYQWLFSIDNEAYQSIKEGNIYARIAPNSPSFTLTTKDYLGLPNRSRHLVTLKLYGTLPAKDWSWNTRLMYRSKFAVNDDNGNGVIDKYDDLIKGIAILDISINKKIGEQIEASIGLDNLLNYTHPLIPNYGGRLASFRINYTFIN
jgi:outer membrane receptor for ferrienterochelin and colicins